MSTTPSVTIDLVGLEPGITILITETIDSAGDVTITIALPPASALSGQSASGVVTEVDTDAFVLHTSGGSDLRLDMAPGTLSALNLVACDTVDVTYHQDANLLIADSVDVTGTSTTGECAPGGAGGQGSGGGGEGCSDQCAGDVTGTITQVSGSEVTINADQGGSMAFVVDDPDITAGFQVGDYVDVTYSTNHDGKPDASDVEFAVEETSGVATTVSSSTMAITATTPRARRTRSWPRAELRPTWAWIPSTACRWATRSMSPTTSRLASGWRTSSSTSPG